MKARLLVLLAAAACAAAGAGSYFASPYAHGTRSPIVRQVSAPAVDDPVQQRVGGWWDWHKSDV